MQNAFREFRDKDISRQSCDVTDAGVDLEHLTKASDVNIAQILPNIIQETNSLYLCVRRLAAFSLYKVTTRVNGSRLVSGETELFTRLLVDVDIPIRRIAALAIYNLHLDAHSPMIPALENYLAREDAVSTIGAAVATDLMIAAPDRIESMNAVVRYMGREDHTEESRDSMLIGVSYAKSKDPNIGREVATCANDPNEQIGVRAVRTLQGMGKAVVSDNQLLLAQIAGDSTRTANIRKAAAQALTSVQ